MEKIPLRSQLFSCAVLAGIAIALIVLVQGAPLAGLMHARLPCRQLEL